MFEAENEKASDFVDASTSLLVNLEASCVAVLVPPIVEVLKADEQPLHSTKEETSDVFLDANSSAPIDVEAKNDDASFITEVMTKEEEQLYEARLKLEEEEEARKGEEAARLAFYPNANSSVRIDLEAKNDDASFISEVMTKEEEQLYEARFKVEEEDARKREQAARLAFDPNANSSVPIDLEAKNGDASFITEVMTKEEEQLYEARLKVEEEEARQGEQAAFDPNACFSKLDELLTETQLYSEFLLEKMEQITDV